MGTTAWRYGRGEWTEATSAWKSNDAWGWREELRQNGYEVDPAVRLGDIDADTFALEAYAVAGEDKSGWAVIVAVGSGGDVVLVDQLPDLVSLMKEVGPAVGQVQEMNLGATNAQEREYARLRRLGYPHELADEASQVFADEIGDEAEE